MRKLSDDDLTTLVTAIRGEVEKRSKNDMSAVFSPAALEQAREQLKMFESRKEINDLSARAIAQIQGKPA